MNADIDPEQVHKMQLLEGVIARAEGPKADYSASAQEKRLQRLCLIQQADPAEFERLYQMALDIERENELPKLRGNKAVSAAVDIMRKRNGG